MIIVATLALGTMVSNDVILPLLARHRGLRERWETNPGPALLAARRVAVVGIMALAYLCYLAVGSAFPLAAIGLISFAAVAQFAPALIGGMFWRRATAAGAIAGIGAGFVGWVWTVAVPAVVTAGWLPHELLARGPLGVAWLSPVGLGGLTLDPMLHGLLWSLGPNLALFVGVSLATEPSVAERRQAERFVGIGADAPRREPAPRAASLADLHELAARYVGRERADATFRALAGAGDGEQESLMPARGDAEAVQATERLLAGAIGSASARVVVASLLSDRRFSRADARELIDEASRAILGQHEMMRDALQNIRQGLCAFDVEFRVTLWNPRFLELCDLPAELVQVGTSLEEIVRYNEARGEYGQGQFDTLLARRRHPARRDRPDVYERRRPDGTVLEVSTTPMPSGGFVAVYTDVTERDLAAAALREANEALEARVGERTLALSAAKAEAERANLGKTRFLAAAGHDLMQPLQAARLFLSALAERSRDPAVGQIDASLDSVEHLLGELVEVSKLDSGVTAPSLVDFRLADVLRPLGEEFSALARQHGLGFRAVACSASVRSDPALLRRILQNFLANALRYTRTGPHPARLPPPRRRDRARDLGHRPGRPRGQAQGDLPGVPSPRAGQGRRGGARARALDRRAAGRADGPPDRGPVAPRAGELLCRAGAARRRSRRGAGAGAAGAAALRRGARGVRRERGGDRRGDARAAGRLVLRRRRGPDRRGGARPARRPPAGRAAQRLPPRRGPDRPRGAGAAARPPRADDAGRADHRRSRPGAAGRRRGRRLPAAAQAGASGGAAGAARPDAGRAGRPGRRVSTRRRYWFMLMKLSRISSTAGPISTMKSAGRMKIIIGTVIVAGSRPAFSSARSIRSLRCSWESTLKARASGVPYFSAWIMVLQKAFTEGSGARSARFSSAWRRSGMNESSSAVWFSSSPSTEDLRVVSATTRFSEASDDRPASAQITSMSSESGSALRMLSSRFWRTFLMKMSGALLPSSAAATTAAASSAAPLPIGSAP